MLEPENMSGSFFTTMIKINEAIIVEGKYDKIKLSGIVDTVIVSVNGFNVFKDADKQKLIRKLAQSRGIIVFTDSDRAGFLIRNFICGIVQSEKVRHAYVPQIEGVEKRKSEASKDGFLGVEGISDDILLDAILKASTRREEKKDTITKADFMRLGLSGRPDSREKRGKLLKNLDLPKGISANALVEILNLVYNIEEISDFLNRL